MLWALADYGSCASIIGDVIQADEHQARGNHLDHLRHALESNMTNFLYFHMKQK